MNNAILQDKIFAFYTKLPHCLICRKKHIRDVRSRFHYDELSDISIFAANCVGGEIYSLLGLNFTSPLINISINRDSFITMCAHLKKYLSQPINVTVASTGNCIGIISGGGTTLPEIEVRFPHDTDPEEVQKKWKRRCARVNYDKLVFINDDKGLTEADFAAYDAIPAFRKICLTSKDMNDRYDWCFRLKEYEGKECTGEYNGKSLNGLWKFTKIWDYVSFLNGDK